MLAEWQSKSGDVERRLDLLDKALVVVKRNDELFFDAEIHLLKEELLLKLDGDESELEKNCCAAEICFQNAIKLLKNKKQRCGNCVPP
jgi:hypothetical protein